MAKKLEKAGMCCNKGSSVLPFSLSRTQISLKDSKTLEKQSSFLINLQLLMSLNVKERKNPFNENFHPTKMAPIGVFLYTVCASMHVPLSAR